MVSARALTNSGAPDRGSSVRRRMAYTTSPTLSSVSRSLRCCSSNAVSARLCSVMSSMMPRRPAGAPFSKIAREKISAGKVEPSLRRATYSRGGTGSPLNIWRAPAAPTSRSSSSSMSSTKSPAPISCSV